MSALTPIDEVAPQILGNLPRLEPASNSPAAGVFGEIFTQGLNQVNRSLVATQTDLQRLATGEARDLHQVMIKLEESRLSFQLMMQVRNRLLEAYQDVMKMQI